MSFDPSSPTPAPPLPPSPLQLLRDMFVLRPLSASRLVFSIRAGVCMGAPVLIGWLAGDLQAALMAATGGFTSLYGRARPYRSRATELAIIALAFALAVAIGIAVHPVTWAVVPTVAAIAMLATWLGNALKIGPPGPYMFMLACAAGTAMPAGHISPIDAFVLVLGGGALAWLVQMSAALVWPRGPERRAVTAAGRAVAGFIDAVGTPRAAKARQQAAVALHDAWQALVSYQPANAAEDGPLASLRQRNRELHALFAQVMDAAARQQPAPADALARARALGDLSVEPPAVSAAVARGEVPFGHPDVVDALRESLRPRSMAMLVVGRVGLAALVAGAIGAVFDLERAYWAVAAAVLMLHQGMEWVRMVQRSIERMIGTWVGLLLAGAVLWFHPQGLWLVAVIVVLQFTVEMLVMRNYPLAAIFITAAGLTLAAGGQPVPDLGGYLLARGVDTAVGCAVALAVFQVTWPQASAALIPEQLLRTFAAVQTVAGHLAQGDVTSVAARKARRDLQHRSFALAAAYETAIAASRRPRQSAERRWPVIAATEQIAYRLLAACWAIERIGGEAGRVAARSMFPDGGLDGLGDALEQGRLSIQDDRPLEDLGTTVPDFIRPELEQLHRALRSEVA